MILAVVTEKIGINLVSVTVKFDMILAVCYRLTDDCPTLSVPTQHMSLRSMYGVTGVAS